MITFSRTIAAFLMFSFSLTLLPMDPPLAITQQASPKIEGVAWGNIDEKREKFGLFLAVLAEEHITLFLVQLPPSGKNNLRKTNKTFGRFLSWENIQPFMLRKELCATEWDIKSIIIQNLYEHKDKSRNPMPIYKQEFIKAMEQRFGQRSYPIIGCIDDRCESLEFPKRVGNPDFMDSRHENGVISSLVIACIARNPHNLEKCLIELRSIEKHLVEERLQEISTSPFNSTDLERALHIVIQNNDIRLLDILLTNKYAKKIASNLSSKLLQLAIFCASDKVIEPIVCCYKKKYLKDGTNFKIPTEKDFIYQWLNLTNDPRGDHLRSIIEMRHPKLNEIHAKDNKLEQYHYCLNQICIKDYLQKFDPPVVIPEKAKKEKKDKQEKSIKKKKSDHCIIS
jgi:hypothetical protein